jgi:N-acyl-L-homoserine lactone synthetase
MLDATPAVAGYLKVSVDGLARVRRNGDLRRPVLWAPVVRAAA